MSQMKRSTIWCTAFLMAAVVTFLILSPVFQQTAQAVPSFSRQTGLACKACHLTPPELNAFGRDFKLNGYTMKTAKTVKSAVSKREGGLDLLESLPLSAFINVAFESTNTAVPGTRNGSAEIPQGVSLFLSGAWSENFGSWIEFHYSPSEDHFGLEAADIRYANHHQFGNRDLIYGITINNAPTLEDVWNSSPRWSFPFQKPEAVTKPLAGSVINGPLEGAVAGIGGYAMYGNHLYLDATVYRTAQPATVQPTTGVGYKYNITGAAPYWRAAWQQNTTNNDIEVGTFGLHMNTTPFGVTGPNDTYTDVGGDFQWNRTVPQWGGDVISFRGSYIREDTSLNGLFALGGAAIVNHHLDTEKANVEYHFGNRVSAGVGWQNVTGTPDSKLYVSKAVTGSANGDPRTNGYILDFSWWPVQNLDLQVQYTGYGRFNGGGINYDGAGRNASGNNALYFLGRFVF